MQKVEMPRLDPGMKQGKIIEWLKREGDSVQKGEPICVVETEKTTFEIEAPGTGILRKIIAKEGETVPITNVVAIIANADEKIPEIIQELQTMAEPTMAVAISSERVKVSPAAKRIAEQHGIDLRKIKGTGPDGRIVREDIVQVVEQTKNLPKDTIALEGMRKTIAEKLTESYRTAPHVPIIFNIDVTELLKLRSSLEASKSRKISITAFIVKAAAEALKDFPILNSILEGQEIRLLKAINIGVAVALPSGLIVPVVHNADQLGLFDLSNQIEELAERARNQGLTPHDVFGGTFTISNLGPFGVDIFEPIINPPQSAIIGVGRANQQLEMIDGQIVLRSFVALTLVFDHRVLDGAQAAQFMQKIRKFLENPHLLIPA